VTVNLTQLSAVIVILALMGAGLWRVLTTGTKIVQFLGRLEASVEEAKRTAATVLNRLELHEERLGNHDEILAVYGEKLAGRRRKGKQGDVSA